MYAARGIQLDGRRGIHALGGLRGPPAAARTSGLAMLCAFYVRSVGSAGRPGYRTARRPPRFRGATFPPS